MASTDDVDTLTNRHKTKNKKTKSENVPHIKTTYKSSQNSQSSDKASKFGPLPRFFGQRVWSRGILIVGISIYVWYFSKSTKETSLAKQTEIYDKRGQHIDCSSDYLNDVRRYKGCVPKKCGRHVSDKIVTAHEADTLLRIANKVMALGGSSGGATIMDLHSGALSFNDKFINVYNQHKDIQILSPLDAAIYNLVKKKIQEAIAEAFEIDSNSIHLTHPTFFSRLTNVQPITVHDEYWHQHIDKITYESFHYTSLLYLNDYAKDFQGGRFVFTDDITKPSKNTTVEPRKGRVLMFTSGSENPHYVERVTEGLRFAITVSFTCDISKAIQDPKPK